jgi:predicted MPP superfamily phosphohydrolase
MKTIVLGDTHGRSFWKLAIHQEEPVDRVIFIGDYFDSFDINTETQVNNFLDIIAYKKGNPQVEVIMLIGNHDFHYFPEIGYSGTSGYQDFGKYQIEPIIDANREHLQMAYQMGDFIFTHAGVSSEFMDNTFEIWGVNTIADQLNELFKYQPKKFDFNGINGYGDDTYQTPIWIRPRSLMKVNHDTLRNEVIQVVGHTGMTKIDIEGKATGGRYYFIDTLGTSGEYLIIQDDKITSNSVK